MLGCTGDAPATEQPGLLSPYRLHLRLVGMRRLAALHEKGYMPFVVYQDQVLSPAAAGKAAPAARALFSPTGTGNTPGAIVQPLFKRAGTASSSPASPQAAAAVPVYLSDPAICLLSAAAACNTAWALVSRYVARKFGDASEDVPEAFPYRLMDPAPPGGLSDAVCFSALGVSAVFSPGTGLAIGTSFLVSKEVQSCVLLATAFADLSAIPVDLVSGTLRAATSFPQIPGGASGTGGTNSPMGPRLMRDPSIGPVFVGSPRLVDISADRRPSGPLAASASTSGGSSGGAAAGGMDLAGMVASARDQEKLRSLSRLDATSRECLVASLQRIPLLLHRVGDVRSAQTAYRACLTWSGPIASGASAAVRAQVAETMAVALFEGVDLPLPTPLPSAFQLQPRAASAVGPASGNQRSLVTPAATLLAAAPGAATAPAPSVFADIPSLLDSTNADGKMLESFQDRRVGDVTFLLAAMVTFAAGKESGEATSAYLAEFTPWNVFHRAAAVADACTGLVAAKPSDRAGWSALALALGVQCLLRGPGGTAAATFCDALDVPSVIMEHAASSDSATGSGPGVADKMRGSGSPTSTDLSQQAFLGADNQSIVFANGIDVIASNVVYAATSNAVSSRQALLQPASAVISCDASSTGRRELMQAFFVAVEEAVSLSRDAQRLAAMDANSNASPSGFSAPKSPRERSRSVDSSSSSSSSSTSSSSSSDDSSRNHRRHRDAALAAAAVATSHGASVTASSVANVICDSILLLLAARVALVRDNDPRTSLFFAKRALAASQRRRMPLLGMMQGDWTRKHRAECLEAVGLAELQLLRSKQTIASAAGIGSTQSVAPAGPTSSGNAGEAGLIAHTLDRTIRVLINASSTSKFVGVSSAIENSTSGISGSSAVDGTDAAPSLSGTSLDHPAKDVHNLVLHEIAEVDETMLESAGHSSGDDIAARAEPGSEVDRTRGRHEGTHADRQHKALPASRSRSGSTDRDGRLRSDSDGDSLSHDTEQPSALDLGGHSFAEEEEGATQLPVYPESAPRSGSNGIVALLESAASAHIDDPALWPMLYHAALAHAAAGDVESASRIAGKALSVAYQGDAKSATGENRRDDDRTLASLWALAAIVVSPTEGLSASAEILRSGIHKYPNDIMLRFLEARAAELLAFGGNTQDEEEEDDSVEDEISKNPDPNDFIGISGNSSIFENRSLSIARLPRDPRLVLDLYSKVARAAEHVAWEFIDECALAEGVVMQRALDAMATARASIPDFASSMIVLPRRTVALGTADASGREAPPAPFVVRLAVAVQCALVRVAASVGAYSTAYAALFSADLLVDALSVPMSGAFILGESEIHVPIGFEGPLGTNPAASAMKGSTNGAARIGECVSRLPIDPALRADVIYSAGVLHEAAGAMQAAEAQFAAAAALNPSHVPSLIRLAESAINSAVAASAGLDSPSVSAETYHMLKMAPVKTVAVDVGSGPVAAVSADIRSCIERGESLAKQALRFDPHSVDAWRVLSRAKAAMGRHTEAAEASFAAIDASAHVGLAPQSLLPLRISLWSI
jgi:hypothetical protein